MSTINNDIPFVPENTTDPAAGLNLSLNVIDALLQIAVVAIQNTPPVSPTEGQRYIVGTAGTGGWAGQDNRLARYLDGSWSFYDARIAVNLDDGLLYYRDSTGWVAAGTGSGGIDSPWPGRSESSTSITLDSDDLQQLIETTGASPVITIPAETSDDLGDGFVCYFIHYGTGEITFDDAGVTLIHQPMTAPSVPSGYPCTLLKSRTAADTWYLFGGLEQTS